MISCPSPLVLTLGILLITLFGLSVVKPPGSQHRVDFCFHFCAELTINWEKNWKDPLSHKKMLLWMDNFFNPSFFYVVNFLTPKDFFSSMLHNSAWITEYTNTREHVVSPLWPEVGLVLVWTHPGKVRSAASLNLLYMAPKYHSGAM